MKEDKRQKIYRVIMLIVVVALLTFTITTVLSYNGSLQYLLTSKTTPNNDTSKKLDVLLATVTELIEDKYIGEVNEDELVDGALKGLVESVGDIYTVYYSKEELEEFTTQTLGNFVGIGVYLQANEETNRVEIIEPIEGSPAEEAGVQRGDQIIKVDGVEYTASQLEEISSKIKGEEGTEVSIEVQRNDEILDFTIQRRSVHLNYVASQMLDDNIGYISISTFDEKCASDFEVEYNKLAKQNAKSLIIDLRSNGGGVVDEALAIADMICEKGETTLITIDKDGGEEVVKSETDRKITIPIVVLTDKGTASASEILVAALKENGKAEIVGNKTFGKGVIQELIYLSNGGALKVTSAEYYTPNRNKINKVGIEPNYEVSFDFSNLERDEQLEKAIEILMDKM